MEDSPFFKKCLFLKIDQTDPNAFSLDCHQILSFCGVWDFKRLRLTSMSLDFKFNTYSHAVWCLKVREWNDMRREKPLSFSEEGPEYCIVREIAFIVNQLLGCSSLCCVIAVAVGERTWHSLPFSQLSKSSYILMFAPEFSTIYSSSTQPLQHMSFCELWSFLGLRGLFMFEAEVPAFLPS